MADYRRQRIDRLAREEWATRRAIRHVFEREHGKLNDPTPILKFVTVAGLLMAMVASITDHLQFRVPVLLNAFLIGILLGVIAAVAQAVFVPSVLKGLVEQGSSKDALSRAAAGLALLQTVIWLGATITVGVWLAHQTAARGNTFFWTWFVH